METKLRGGAILVELNPTDTLNVNEVAVTNALKRVLEKAVEGNPFLKSCGVRLSIGEQIEPESGTEKKEVVVRKID